MRLPWIAWVKQDRLKEEKNQTLMHIDILKSLIYMQFNSAMIKLLYLSLDNVYEHINYANP